MPAARRMIRDVVLAAQERRYGVKTEGYAWPADFGFDATDLNEYQPVPWRAFRGVLRREDVGPSDVFLDIGCGMGRALLLAAKFPFKRVIGVELAPQLTEIAEANIARAQHKLTCQDVRVVTADATTYEVPDEVSVVFLYNPFVGQVFEQAFGQVLASLDRAPRRMRLIYRRPTEHDVVMGSGRAKVVTEHAPRSRWGMATPSATRLYELA